MPKKAASKWTIAFLAGFILTIGIILMVVVLPGLFYKEICPRGQEREIFNVWTKVEEMKGKAGYETMYFEVKDCVQTIDYVEIDEYKGNLSVKYKTATETVKYPTNVRWDNTGIMKNPRTYYLKVFEDRVEVVGVS